MICNDIACIFFFAGQDLSEFEERYSEVVRNQAIITLKITKCTTIGPPRTGKTCFKHLLIGKQWDVEAGTASTDVIEAPEWVECYSVEEGGAEELWKLITKEEQQGELLRAVNTLTEGSTELITTSSDVPATATPSDSTPCEAPSLTSGDALPTVTPTGILATATPSDTTPSKSLPTTKSSDFVPVLDLVMPCSQLYPLTTHPVIFHLQPNPVTTYPAM